ncbi:MAG: hypothetical protein EPO39_12880, partial [Candidatus Manganitrophaceae bacterium]
MKGSFGLFLLAALFLLSSAGCRTDPNQINQRTPPSEERQNAPPVSPGLSPHGRGGPYFLNGSFSTGEGSYVRSLLADGDALWVGTSEGIIKVARRTGAALQSYTMADGLKSPYIFTM